MHYQGRLVLATQSYRNGQTLREGIHCWVTLEDGKSSIPMDTVGDPNAIDNGKRLVDCWNALAGVPDLAAFVAKVRALINTADGYPELNMSNYDADDVACLNAWGYEVAKRRDDLAALLPSSPTSGE